ncbi:MAG TPA: BlaI/MecI/CopY family transcriptional regulator [Pirellulales bacterium]|jgi:predicted transcriptional regulator|nr:BlaI/MecI/CopY family transcriptional regulator [Pirellulales bacterium]
MAEPITPTERELDILKVLWDRGESTVREVYEELRPRLAIAQNTVQAFLRTMEEKGLVRHRLEGRTFIYHPVPRRQQTTQHLAGQLLQRAFDGAIDQLVQSVLALRKPTADELARLEELIVDAKAAKRKPVGKKES